MTSYVGYPLYCTGTSRYPYVGKVPVRKEDNVDFIYQFVKDGAYSPINNNANIYHTAQYIIGTPTKFPNYGDFPETFVMRTYGFDISPSSWQAKAQIDYKPQNIRSRINNPSIEISNYLDINFHEAVYPIRVSIYEIYNPGNIIQILAQDPRYTWFPLWDGSPQIVPLTSRLFSPPLRSCTFKTSRLRLIFKSDYRDYYTRIDAVMLIGTSQLIFPRNPTESLTDLLKKIDWSYPDLEDVHNLTADYKTAHLHIYHLQKNFPKYCIYYKSYKSKLYPNNFEFKTVHQGQFPEHVQKKLCTRRNLHLIAIKNNYAKHKLFSNKSKEPRCSLSVIPDEIILKILKNFDLMPLHSMSFVNKRFNNLAWDPLLYTRFNVRNICGGNPANIHNIFRFFTSPRCKYLRQLDLTYSEFHISNFKEFLENCGGHLTHLRLGHCKDIDDSVLLKISTICKDLKELDLRYCKRISDEGFSYLGHLQDLEHLRLGFTRISAESLCKILQRNQRMRELNLEHLLIKDLDAVLIKLSNLCQGLEIINLQGVINLQSVYRVYRVTSQSINALANCKNLRKMNLDLITVTDDSLHSLLSSFQHLEEVHLWNIVLTDHNLKLLTQCRDLKELYLSNMKFVTPERCYYILEQCAKLQKLHLENRDTDQPLFINYNGLVNQCKNRYPHVFVYSSMYFRPFQQVEFLIGLSYRN